MAARNQFRLLAPHTPGLSVRPQLSQIGVHTSWRCRTTRLRKLVEKCLLSEPSSRMVHCYRLLWIRLNSALIWLVDSPIKTLASTR
jgi:hypothetical protein